MSYEVGSAAVALSKLVADSPQCKELLSRIFLAIVTDEKHRGKLVQQGGGKVSPVTVSNLISLSAARDMGYIHTFQFLGHLLVCVRLT